ncbi:DUF6081 family protein [Candidatus Entotheonella palauensis]|uniref:DUF6081 family protein n=1 Tax=Candidatus Entotheonella palauensis TaxID=93172 RepID=UPI0011789C97|nr:DUF6081 family protein [Candidatus Entotheonella palauensis]
MFKIKRLGHVAITVPNVEEAAAFYENIVGLEISDRIDGAVFLRCNAEHHCLGIYPGATKGLHHLGLEVRDEEALQAAHEVLASQGFQPQTRAYAEPGHGAALCYQDPDGNLIELYEGMETSDQPLQPREIRPLKFGHITLLTTDLKRAVAFYTEVLGFRVSDTAEDSVIWLRCNQEHHGIALLNADQAKVNHYAYDLADWNEIKRMCDHLWRNDVPIIYGPSRHGPGHNLFIYIPDPAGNVIELTTELDLIWDEDTYRPLNWTNEPKTVDVWRGLPAPAHMLAGEGRDFHDWSAGSPVIDAGWHIVQADDFVALDPAATITPPIPKQPEFKIEIPRFTLSFDDPRDHVKALVATDHRFPTGNGFSVAVDMAVDVSGTDANPFGADPDDPRLGCGSIALIDDSTGVVLNFEVSNRRVLALREYFAVMAPGGTGSVVPLADPVLTDLTIEPGSWHRYEIRYDPGVDGMLTPGSDRAEWLVDGELVHQVSWVASVDPPAAPVIKPIRFSVNMAIFTLLDNLPDGRGGILPGLDPEYRQSIFGQGVTARWRNLDVRHADQQWHVR